MDHITPDSNRSERPDPLHTFAELARIVADVQPPQQILRNIADLVKQTLDGVEEVSLTLIEARHPRTLVSTGPLAVQLDDRQYKAGFGPCLDAAKSGQIIVVDCKQDDTPYRDFARVADRAGVRHIISVGMPLAQRTIGCLNVYHAAAAPISSVFLQHAEVFADSAAAVVSPTGYASAENGAPHLRIARQSRAVIEQARGVIMARHRCTADEALDILTRISQQQNIELHDLARVTIESTTT